MGHAANTPNDFHSKFIKTDVTAIKINFNFILAGIGNVLHVFNITNKQCQFFTALREQRIHGIRFNASSDLVAIYGNREIAIASFHSTNTEATFTLLHRWIVGDWICDVKWSKDSDKLLILTANNIISVWDWRKSTSSQSAKCRDKCLLFCGIILNTEWSDSIVMCGTMFRSILIWAPSKATTGDTCGVLHKLTGHKGAIFSVFYHQKSRRICSTSDDRSVRIWLVNFSGDVSVVEAWSQAEIIPLFTVYGHMSRVWKSFILDDGRFVSAGEDSQLRVWNKNGKPLHTWETHQGASIRSLDVCEKLNIIVTGGKDGGISLWPLHVDCQNTEIAFSDELNFRHSRDVPRRLLLAKSGNLLTTTNEGKLLVYSKSKWQYVHSDTRFASYCLFEISPSKAYFSWASLRGDLKIFQENTDQSVSVIYAHRICSGKIFSIHWLSDCRFITCCTNGTLEVWDLILDSNTSNVRQIGQYILPACKERWLTSAAEFQNQIIVGDREGSIHVFCDDGLPRQTFRRIHGRLGVSGISRSTCSEFSSIGRDGFIRYWSTDGGTAIEHKAADKLPVKWPVRVLSSPTYGLLVLGFNEINFEVWNVKERKQLFTYKCGGGHRPWDFIIEGQAQFVYIREKIVCRVLLPLNQLMKPSYLEGFHIRDTVCIRFLNENFIISGGEDTTLRLSKIVPETRIFKPIAIVRSHISSIRAITFLRIEDSILVVSAGGRAQLKVWKLTIIEDTISFTELASHMLKSSNKSRKPWINMIPTFELEPRHMDLQIDCVNQTDFTIYAAGSDAFWRIYSFNLSTKTLQLSKEIEYPNYCILKLLLVNWHHQKFVITFATDGKATFWDTNSNSITYQQSLHQSGINSYDYTMVDEYLFLVTGGDDTSLVATSFAITGEGIKTVVQRKNSSVHEAQVSGIRVVKNYIISVGADQKVVLWQWELTHKVIQLDFKIFCHSFVPDIHGLDVSPSKNNTCVFGAGFEVLSVDT